MLSENRKAFWNSEWSIHETGLKQPRIAVLQSIIFALPRPTNPTESIANGYIKNGRLHDGEPSVILNEILRLDNNFFDLLVPVKPNMTEDQHNARIKFLTVLIGATIGDFYKQGKTELKNTLPTLGVMISTSRPSDVQAEPEVDFNEPEVKENKIMNTPERKPGQRKLSLDDESAARISKEESKLIRSDFGGKDSMSVISSKLKKHLDKTIIGDVQIDNTVMTSISEFIVDTIKEQIDGCRRRVSYRHDENIRRWEKMEKLFTADDNATSIPKSELEAIIFGKK